VQSLKIDAINNGTSPIQEPGLAELIQHGYQTKLFTATTDIDTALRKTEISLVCVGTPSQSDGEIDLTYLKGVCQQIGRVIAHLNRPHTVVIRSTVLPDALDRVIVPALREAAGDKAPLLKICANPEFLREGSAISDFDRPPMIVIGEQQEGDGEALVRMYAGINAPIFHVGLKEAFMIKYACNIFHALKISFGNEIGQLCQAEGIDSHTVMQVFCEDRDANISPRYLKPGFAYGGSCLPKDLRAMLSFGRTHNIDTPMLASIGRSNSQHIEKCVQAVLATGARRVGVLGLSFKDDTDDLRESPTVEIVERLIGKGLEVTVHDKDVDASRIFGRNLSYVQQHLPHIASLLKPTVEEVVRSSQAVLLAKPSRQYAEAQKLLTKEQVLVDFVRYFSPKTFDACKYVGIVG
jgi:GDP-mannose 6-dehydrogenase